MVVDATVTGDRVPPVTRAGRGPDDPAAALPPATATVVVAVATTPVAGRVTRADGRTAATEGSPTARAAARRGADPTGGTGARTATVGPATVPGAATTVRPLVTGAARPVRAATGTSDPLVRVRGTGGGTTGTRPSVVATVQARVTTAEVATAAGTHPVPGPAGIVRASTAVPSRVTPRGRRSPTRCRSRSSTARRAVAYGR